MNKYLAAKQHAFDLMKETGKKVIDCHLQELDILFRLDKDFYDFFVYCNKEHGLTKREIFFYANTLMECENSINSLFPKLDWAGLSLFYAILNAFPHIDEKGEKVKEFFYMSFVYLYFFVHVINNQKGNFALTFLLHDLYKKKQFDEIKNLFYSNPNIQYGIDSESPFFESNNRFFSTIIQPYSSSLYNSYTKEATEDCLFESLIKTKDINEKDYGVFLLIEFMNELLFNLGLPKTFLPSSTDLLTVKSEFLDKTDKKEIMIGNCLILHLVLSKNILDLERNFDLSREEIFDFFASLSRLINATDTDFKVAIDEIEQFLKNKGII